MYIRKKNNENSRIKRPAKRSKSCDMFFTSGYGFYLKPIAIFSALLTIDFLMEIRVEYLWSCWLLMKSITDSYKYQGLVFSLFFMLIVVTSDIICYLLIPITWLFFLASSYVWIQLVGYTERGICLPTVIICSVFFYIEYILRLRGFSHLSLSMEICRPFASNSIGYPVVTMGFGLKSYVSYKFRMRKQRDVEAKNRFVFQIVDQALPEGNKRYRVAAEDGEIENSSFGEDSVDNSSVETPPPTSSNSCTGISRPPKPSVSNGKLENMHSSDPVVVKSQSGSADYLNQWPPSSQHKSSLSNGHIRQCKPAITNGSCIPDVSCASLQAAKKGSSCNQGNKHNKDDLSKGDSELRKLRSDLQTGRLTESDLRTQLAQANHIHNSMKTELSQCRQELSSVHNKCQALHHKYQTEKQTNQMLEKKYNEEKKNSQSLEQQLGSEKKARKEESDIKSKALQSATLAAARSSECTESCKSKRRQLDAELKSLKKEKQSREDQIRSLEQQLSDLPRLRNMMEECQHMSMTIAGLREEKEHLVRTLSDENKIKQNLITAYHSSLKEVNALNEQLTQKDYQILQLNMGGAVPDYLGNSHHHHQQQQQQHYLRQQQQHRHRTVSPPASSSPGLDDSSGNSYYSVTGTNSNQSMTYGPLATPNTSMSISSSASVSNSPSNAAGDKAASLDSQSGPGQW